MFIQREGQHGYIHTYICLVLVRVQDTSLVDLSTAWTSSGRDHRDILQTSLAGRTSPKGWVLHTLYTWLVLAKFGSSPGSTTHSLLCIKSFPLRGLSPAELRVTLSGTCLSPRLSYVVKRNQASAWLWAGLLRLPLHRAGSLCGSELGWCVNSSMQ